MTGGLRPGDAFPILYTVKRMPDGVPWHATSMPFPIPFSDIDSLYYRECYKSEAISLPEEYVGL